MKKIDFKKDYKDYFKAKADKPFILTIPELKYVTIDGFGDPNNSEFYSKSLEALYGLIYTIKFGLKKTGEYPEFSVSALEGLWWSDDLENFSMDKRDDWKWKMMILIPDFISAEIFEEFREDLFKKKNNSRINDLNLEFMNEGLSAQILHIGPYSEEPPTIYKLHQFIFDNGYNFNGLHKEIYLGDPRKTAPEKLKTIIRYPIIKS